MNFDTQRQTDKEDKPLTREDVERLLHEAGSPDKLDLSGRNLEGINLSHFSLDNADLSGVNLSSADLTYAHMGGAKLTNATLTNATLHGTNLFSADLRGAKLTNATLTNTTLALANLSGADLTGADLSSVNLLGAANLSGIKMGEVEKRPIIIPQSPKEQLHDSGAIGLSEPMQAMEYVPTIRIRILEEPLTAQNLTTILSALTELHTKCWLIAEGRLSDLIEYTQTHNIRFVEEANLVITKLRHNSPAEMELAQGKSTDIKSKLPISVDVKVEATPDAVMKAVGTAIDGVVQAPLRFKEKQQEIKQAEQRAAQESQMALLEKEKQELENERLRLELIEKRLEVQKKGIEYALEIASKTVDVLYPTANAEAKAMITRTLLPTILQLDNVKGLELVLPAPQSGEEKTETKQNG